MSMNLERLAGERDVWVAEPFEAPEGRTQWTPPADA